MKASPRGLVFFNPQQENNMSWYTLQTKPNYEAKVLEGIELRRTEKNIHQIREVFAPEEIIVEYKDGKKKERKKRLYTNYIFVEMDYSDEVWHALKGIKGVVGFLGNKSHPTVLPQREIDSMKKAISDETPKHKVTFELETKVRITSGSFADFFGIIKSVDYEKNKAKVMINIFSRETEVELSLTDIELATE